MRTANLAALLIGAFCIAVALVGVSGGPWILKDYTVAALTPPEPFGGENPYGIAHYAYRSPPDTVWLAPLLVFGSIYFMGGVLTARLGATRSYRRAGLGGAVGTPLAFAVLCLLTWRPLLPSVWPVLAGVTMLGTVAASLGGWVVQRSNPASLTFGDLEAHAATILRTLSGVFLGGIFAFTVGAAAVSVTSNSWLLALAIAGGCIAGGWLAARVAIRFPIVAGVLGGVPGVMAAVGLLGDDVSERTGLAFTIYIAAAAFGGYVASRQSAVSTASRELHAQWLPTELWRVCVLVFIGLYMAFTIAEVGAPWLWSEWPPTRS